MPTNVIKSLSLQALADFHSQFIEITHPLTRLVKDRIDGARALDALIHDRELPLRDEVDDDRLTGGDLMWAVGILINALEGDIGNATSKETQVSGGRLRQGGQQHQSLRSLLSPHALLVDENSEGATEAPRPTPRLRDDDGNGPR